MKAARVAVPRCRVQEIRASREKLAKVVPAERELQIPRLPPDFLSGLVASVKPRAAFLKESRIRGRWLVQRVGNPEFARDDKGEGCAHLNSRDRGMDGAPTAKPGICFFGRVRVDRGFTQGIL